jgi:hypothetical protein
VFRLILVTNAIHLEAARRIRLRQRQPGEGRLLDLLIYEPRRLGLTPEDRRRWPLRLPVTPLVMVALVLPALLGLVGELRLAHLSRAGKALRLVARRARRISLLDDGLDQYRDQPRAVDPLAFPAGTPCWLFSDAAAFRAPWCRRFDCRDLGPLYGAGGEGEGPAAATYPASRSSGDAAACRTLIIDAPGVERLQSHAARLPRPWLVVPHPVIAKRHWTLPPAPGDLTMAGPPEGLLAAFTGLVVVGESMTLLAALRLRPPGSRLLVALPESAAPNLRRLVQGEAALDPLVECL